MLGFITDFWAVDDDERRQSLIPEPPLTGDPRWDALLAALAEHLAFHAELPMPAWADDPQRFLTTFWFPVDLPSIRARALITSPASMARRGVMIDRLDLERV